MMLVGLGVFALICAAIPCLVFLSNLAAFRPALRLDLERQSPRPLSLLIPARDEAAGIASTLQMALASTGVELEVIVLDDHSTDGTVQIVQEIANADPRLRLVSGRTLPEGWNGKQHACYQLARDARYETMVFIDADVRLQPDALARLFDQREKSQVALLSAFPRQLTGTWSEQWLIPLMHFILLGFLPLKRMRATTDPAFAAGCGQLFLTTKEDYRRAGTHAAIQASRHDGIKLPRIYRQARLSTDIVDGTDIAACRMYRDVGTTTRGLLKNAHEGIANVRLIVPFSVLLLGGAVLPWLTLIASIWVSQGWGVCLSLLAIAMFHLPRALAALRFRQAWQGVVFHSLAVAWFVGLQWIALFRQFFGRPVAWRGRMN